VFVQDVTAPGCLRGLVSIQFLASGSFRRKMGAALAGYRALRRKPRLRAGLSDRTAFHYRDLWIQAFNQDFAIMTPSHQMVLAGDDSELAQSAGDESATGFPAAGVCNATQITAESEVEKERYDELDDMKSRQSAPVALGPTAYRARATITSTTRIPTRDYTALWFRRLPSTVRSSESISDSANTQKSQSDHRATKPLADAPLPK
jgi:hypothetical protein